MPQDARMTHDPNQPQSADAIAAELRGLSPDYAPTPLLDLPTLAAHLGVGQLLAKDEGRRMLGSFKSLGGTYAGLRALARAAGTDVSGLLADQPKGQPTLICASDGNHGLAVALAGRFAGATARVFLHATVPAARGARIDAMGAAIIWVDGTYDDAVDAAAAAAKTDGGILVADTTDAAFDLVVDDVMAGYGVIAAEIRQQILAASHQRPTHAFVQAGVGGLAAATAEGLKTWMAPPAMIVVVEPVEACCIAPALAAGHAVRMPGSLKTAAEMLSCGEASTPALRVLQRHDARVVTVTEDTLIAAPHLLRDHQGPPTTPSGGASLAGVMAAMANPVVAASLNLDGNSRVVIIVSEVDFSGITP